MPSFLSRRLLALALLAVVLATPRRVDAQSTWKERLKAAAARQDSIRRARADSIAATRGGTPAATRAAEPSRVQSSGIEEFHAEEVRPATSESARPAGSQSVSPAPRAAEPRRATPAATPATSVPAATPAREAPAPRAATPARGKAPNFVGTYFSWGIINTKLLILSNGTWETAQSRGRWTAQGRMIVLDGNARGWCGGRGILNAEETQLNFDCVSKDGFPMNISFAKHSAQIER